MSENCQQILGDHLHFHNYYYQFCANQLNNMNKILLSVIALVLLAACNNSPKTETQTIENVKGTAVFGDSVKNDHVIELASIQAEMKGESKKDMKIKGIVKEVCQEKGCWMTMTLDNGDEMRVTFKDYKIFVPKDLGGKEVVLEGFAYTDTTSVEKLRHYAKDGGKSEAEIAAITSPKEQLAFEAKGVVVMN